MRNLTAGQLAALALPYAKRRTFIWIEGRDPITGLPDPAGFWDDIGNVTVDSRTYVGSGSVVSISSISARSDLSIPGITITLTGISTAANNLVRDTSLSQAPVEISYGIFDVSTRALLPPLFPLFIGQIDKVDINTPEAGGSNNIVLTCESASRALTIKRTGTRSQETQVTRNAADRFMAYTNAIRDQTIYFGRRDPNNTLKGKR